VSIGHMFMGGVFPGLLLSALFIGYISIRCWLQPELGPAPSLKERQQHSWKVKFIALKSVILPILLIIGVLGSIYLGIATPPEAAGVGCLGARLSAAIYRRLTLENLWQSVFDTAKITAMILWITIGARCFISVFSAVGGDELIIDLVSNLHMNRWFVLILIQLLLVFLGLFLDEIGIILLCVPIFLPIIKALEFDPVWFGILFLVNAQMDYITPPFGYTLFYLRGVAPPEVNMADIYRSVVPFVLLQALGLALCMIFPQIILWLPSMLK
jgi:tripartite ATP-independent transporter DctM subunit